MADRQSREERREEREERKENRAQEAFFTKLDRMDEGEYQNFVRAFNSNPESAIGLAFAKERNLPENAMELARQYIDTNARNERQYAKALQEIAQDAKPLASVLAACKAGKLDSDVCDAAHDVLGELNKIATPPTTDKGFDGNQR